MRVKITEQIIKGGLGGHKTRSKVEELPKDAEIPEGAVQTDEAARDWQIDEPKEDGA